MNYLRPVEDVPTTERAELEAFTTNCSQPL